MHNGWQARRCCVYRTGCKRGWRMLHGFYNIFILSSLCCRLKLTYKAMNKGLTLITGADGGMGTILTQKMLEAGYDVIMACYSAEIARPIYEKMCKNYTQKVYLMQVDLGDLNSVKKLAEEILSQFTSLQIILNNAGVLCHSAQVSPNNIEYTAAVNYIGHYVLNHLLLPIMGKGSQIVSMASHSYQWYNLKENFLAPKTQSEFNRFVQYANSKLSLYYYTLDAAKRWKERGIRINIADPGDVSTGIIRQGNKIIDFLCDIFYRPFIRTPEQGAATMLAVALNPEYQKYTGTFFKKGKPCKPNKKYTDNIKEQKMLQAMTEKILAENNIILPQF